MSFTIKYCDIEFEDCWQISVNKLWKCAQGMLGVLDMITKLILPILLNKLILRGTLEGKKILNLNIKVVFFIKHALDNCVSLTVSTISTTKMF